MSFSIGGGFMVTKVEEPIYPDEGVDKYEPPPSARQIDGNHYVERKVQPWDFIVANRLDFWQGNILKYITRWRDKDGVIDLKKARHYLDKYIELAESKDPSI